jgi:hypothetical protein
VKSLFSTRLGQEHTPDAQIAVLCQPAILIQMLTNRAPSDSLMITNGSTLMVLLLSGVESRMKITTLHFFYFTLLRGLEL